MKTFKYYDLNNNGKLEFNEFQKGIEKLGINTFSRVQLNELFKFYDTDDSGELNYKEFSKVV